MEIDIQASIEKMFRDATMQSAVIQLRSQDDWDRFNAIREHARTQKEAEEQNFERDRPKLLAKAREELIHRAGALTHEHPTPVGTDRFDKDRINTQAEKLVDQAHQARLQAIQTEEVQGFVLLKDDILAREGSRGRARESFNRVNDSRNGQDRHHPTRAR